MADTNQITEDNFTFLLQWLDPDQDAAVQKYETIRRRLTRVLVGRGCFEADILVDETFNRVTVKAARIADEFTADPAYYFYGVANKVHLEWLRKQRTRGTVPFTFDPGRQPEEDRSSPRFDCLDGCLDELPAENRTLILEYYKEDRTAKIELRQRIADRMKISANSLHVKACRIRQKLQACVQNCLKNQ